MAVWKVALSLLKKQKAYVVTIFCLSLVVSLMLTSVLTVMKRSGEIQDAAFEASSMPDLLCIYDAEEYDGAYGSEYYEPALAAQFADLRDRSGIKSVAEKRSFAVMGNDISVNGGSLNEGLNFFPYQPEAETFKIKQFENGRFTLNQGEILLPLFYEDGYSLSIGEPLIIGRHEFTITGFYEDPMFGSPMVGTRRAFIHESDFDNLYGNLGGMRVFVYVTINAERGGAAYAEQLRTLTQEIIRGDSGYTFNMIEIKQYSMMVSNLVAVILLSLALLSLMITLYVLRYAVLSSIEGNFVTFGAFKAVGFTGGQIRLAVMLQYALVCLLGSVAGVVVSIPLIPVIGALLLDSAGLIWSGSLWVPAGVFVILAAVGLICGITWLNTRKIRTISPVRAISFGRAPVYFAKRLNLPLRRLSLLPLHVRMALKQMMTRRKQYTVLIIITALLTFMITFMGGTSKLLSDNRNVLRIFGFPREDVSIVLVRLNPEVIGKLNRVSEEIKADYPVEKVYNTLRINVSIEGSFVFALCYETFEGIGLIDPVSGRFPKYDNELALSPVTAERFGKGVGDTVVILDAEGDPVPFIVTGIVQNMNEVGQNISILTAGIERISPGFDAWKYSVIFKDGTDLETAAAEIKTHYEDDDIYIYITAESEAQMLDSIRSVVDPTANISLTMTVILVALITLLLATIAIYREHTDIGIYKSTGYTSNQLRLQFSMRFLLVSLTGGLMGAGLSLLASDALISFIFGFFGVPKVRMDLGAAYRLLPVALVCAITFAAAWLVSRRVRRVSGRNLITE
ncbi:MAG: ABC transporter permease [Oscillospiraceae bacterium]|nr:ABC transporter permease [Oscillospiraceae bacterium]